jgi:uncharacterized membrane protein
MDQAIWNTLQGRFFHQTNQPGVTNRLSLHVEPILLPISLLYLIYSGPEILFLVQSVVVALGALPVYGLARRKLNSEALALIFALAYLMFPAIQGANLLDFHAVTLAPTFLLAAFYYLEERRAGRFALFAGLAVATKEDMTLLVLMIGLYAWLINGQRRLGLVTVLLGLLWAYLAVFVIPPALAGTDNIHWGRYEHLGQSPLDIVLNLGRAPQRYVDHLQAVQALTYFRQLLTPTAFLALLNPLTLGLALPSFGLNLLSNFPPMQRVNSLIYAAPTVPAVMISSIYGAANLKQGLIWLGRKLPPAYDRFPLSQIAHGLLGGLVLAASLFYQAQYGYLPGGGQFRGWEEITEHHRRLDRLLAQIPPQAAVSAHDRLDPHVSQRESLYIFDRIEDADHIVLDVTEDSWPLHPVALRHRVLDLLVGDFAIVDAYDGYLLLARDRPDLPTTLPDEFFDFARSAHPRPQYPANLSFAGKIRLLGYDLDRGGHEAALPVVTLYWQALTPLDRDYTLWPFFINRQGQVIEDPAARPLVATLWYPTSAWSTAEVIVTRTLPWDLGPEFTLAVGIAGPTWAEPEQRLPITANDEALYTFENNTWARLGTFQRVGRRDYRPLSLPPPPADDATTQAEFWHVIRLAGVAAPTGPWPAGQPLPFTLHWQASQPLTIDLTTFAHLLDSQGQTVAQLDWIPQDPLGYLPTSAWQPGRIVTDRQTLPLPNDLPPGSYRLVVGWYYPVTGDRLPLTAGQGSDTSQVGLITIR